MGKKYFVTTASHLVPAQGMRASGKTLYEMEDKEFDALCEKQNPASFHVLTKEEFEAEKKMISTPGSETSSQPTQPPPAQPAEEAEVTEAEALKVSKVKSVAKKKKK